MSHAQQLLFGARPAKTDGFAIGSALVRDYEYLLRARNLPIDTRYGSGADYDWPRQTFRTLALSAPFIERELTQLFLVVARGRPLGQYEHQECFLVGYLGGDELFVSYEGMALSAALAAYTTLARHYRQPAAECPTRRTIHDTIAAASLVVAGDIAS
jgi:hypothetical protein